MIRTLLCRVLSVLGTKHEAQAHRDSLPLRENRKTGVGADFCKSPRMWLVSEQSKAPEGQRELKAAHTQEKGVQAYG